MSKKPMGLLATMMDFFGRLPGQSLKEFSIECSKLTTEDKKELRTLLEAEGYTISDSTIKK